MTDPGLRLLSAFGFMVMIGIAVLCSSDRRRIPWVTVAWGVGIQLLLALILLESEVGHRLFDSINWLVGKLLEYTNAGASFVFGPLMKSGFSFVLGVLPVIIFMGSLFAVLYHLGVIQPIVSGMAFALSRTMRLSGAESLAAGANIFVGMVESCLVIKPYVERMTRSELFSTMTVGMATVAGSVLLAYVGMLGGGDFAGHLVTASLLSAPAALLIAKIMIPETEQPVTGPGTRAKLERTTSNVVDAAAEGALAGMRLAAYVGGMLLAFVALITMFNDILGGLGEFVGVADLSLQGILGLLLAPLAFVMGIPPADVVEVGGLLGMKTVLNEFIAYQQLGQLIEAGEISQRSQIIASYALCGFANFGSLAILLAGITGIAPSRRHDVAALGIRSIVAGSLTTFMTACLAGVLI